MTVLENKEDELNKLELSMRTCERCALYKSRKNLVFGMGNPNAQVMFIAEAPGKTEDETSKLFVGKSGQLLDKIFKAIAISREDFKITRQHGQWICKKGFYLTATYHPSALLRNPSMKKDAWEDFKKIRSKMNEFSIQD